MPDCFNVINDLGALDVLRARDHGIGTYNQLRAAYGLEPQHSFTAITGERTSSFPRDRQLTRGQEINDPDSLDVMSLYDIDGHQVDAADPDKNLPVRDVRRTTLAARLRAIYHTVDRVDAFVGVNAEAHVPGTEMGETELAIWTREFTRLRDGDRFFYGNDQGLSFIRTTFGIDFRHTLADVIEANTDLTADELNPTGNVFLTPDDNLPATTCAVTYRTTPTGDRTFRADLTVTNQASTALPNWNLHFELANGQSIRDSSGATVHQGHSANGRDVTVSGTNLGAGQTATVRLTGRFDGMTNAAPPNFRLGRSRCASA
jgi:hypothetical protein